MAFFHDPVRVLRPQDVFRVYRPPVRPKVCIQRPEHGLFEYEFQRVRFVRNGPVTAGEGKETVPASLGGRIIAPVERLQRIDGPDVIVQIVVSEARERKPDVRLVGNRELRDPLGEQDRVDPQPFAVYVFLE